MKRIIAGVLSLAIIMTLLTSCGAVQSYKKWKQKLADKVVDALFDDDDDANEKYDDEDDNDRKGTGQTEEKHSGKDSTRKENSRSTKSDLDFTVIPSENASVIYETYVDPSGYFTMEIPEGWKVQVGLPPTYDVDLISYAIAVYDPQNPDRKLYFNLNCTGDTMSQEAADWYERYYAGTFGQLPVVSPVTTEGFFSAFGDIYGYSDFSVIENVGTTVFQGDLLNATAVSQTTGKKLQGLFTATVTYYSYPVQVDLFDPSKGMVDAGLVTTYTIIYETAPQEEFLNWQPVLDHCFASLQFTDSFQSQRQAAWQATLATATYIFNTANEISDMIMDSWERRNTSYDIMSQRQSDATLGYERVLDTETGDYYLTDSGFGDVYHDDRYQVVEDDAAYLAPTAGWIDWK